MGYEVKTTYKTGDRCDRTGRYRFDGYLQQASAEPPADAEREVNLTAGQTFPHIVSTDKGCWWKLVQ